jgi:hypothetical protein
MIINKGNKQQISSSENVIAFFYDPCLTLPDIL